MEWLITNAVGALLMPPGILLVTLFAALVLMWRRPRVARWLVFVVFLAFYVLSIPYTGGHLLHFLQQAPFDPLSDKTGQAIVVLGGGTYFVAPEYGGDTVNALTLVRLRYGAHLYRALGKPVLVSGGAPTGNPVPEAVAMREVLQCEFHVPVMWIEQASNTTLENGRRSFRVLDADGIKRIYLVTHAWHMPRARYAFESAGFTVIPAPTGYATRPRATLLDFVPNASALQNSSWFFHEAIGIGWYHLRVAVGR